MFSVFPRDSHIGLSDSIPHLITMFPINLAILIVIQFHPRVYAVSNTILVGGLEQLDYCSI